MASTSTELMMSTRFWELPQSIGLTENEWRQAVSIILSQELDAKLNMASGLRAFVRAVVHEPAVSKLYGAMLTSRQAREYVQEKIRTLARLEIDRRYQNPNDTALAVLLLLTTFSSPVNALAAADLIDRAPQCWYAKKIARSILNPPAVASDNMEDLPQGPTSVKTLSSELMMTVDFASQLGSKIGENEAVVREMMTSNSLSEALA